ncbi:HipA family kinase [Idiomarina tyrosinivorans]|uniref:HipA family kinase n=1 Tax=Idiomarina tyrosinivorans TaxID=1445662 RepID=UPI003083FFB9
MTFASQFIDGLQEVNYQLMMNFGQKLAANLFIFDLWVRNGDRTLSMKGGNPNVFYQPAEQLFWALDHNLAFDDSFEFNDFTKDHLGRDAWIQQRDLLSRKLYQERASNCLRQLDEIFLLVPDEWDLTDDFMEQIRLTLGLINEDNFWERI